MLAKMTSSSAMWPGAGYCPHGREEYTRESKARTVGPWMTRWWCSTLFMYVLNMKTAWASEGSTMDDNTWSYAETAGRAST